jgi:hypothetical protein
MVTRTAEVTRTKEIIEEEEITRCDNCLEPVEGVGNTFRQINSISELSEPKDLQNMLTIHLCYDCIENIKVEENDEVTEHIQKRQYKSLSEEEKHIIDDMKGAISNIKRDRYDTVRFDIVITVVTFILAYIPTFDTVIMLASGITLLLLTSISYYFCACINLQVNNIESKFDDL